MSGTDPFDAAFAVVAGRLDAQGVACVPIGGFAVNHYGYTRNTLDVDFTIAADDLATVRWAMVDAGFSAVTVDLRGRRVRLPALRDLLAMELFALAHAPARRAAKDLPDLVHFADEPDAAANPSIQSSIHPPSAP
jgi:hypothetical protein